MLSHPPQNSHTHTHTYIHYIHTYITYIHTYIHTLHTYIHTYIHTLHTYIHTDGDHTKRASYRQSRTARLKSNTAKDYRLNNKITCKKYQKAHLKQQSLCSGLRASSTFIYETQSEPNHEGPFVESIQDNHD